MTVTKSEMREEDQREAVEVEVGEFSFQCVKARNRALNAQEKFKELGKEMKDIADVLDEMSQNVALKHNKSGQTHLFEKPARANLDDEKDLLQRAECVLALSNEIFKASNPAQVVKAAQDAAE